MSSFQYYTQKIRIKSARWMPLTLTSSTQTRIVVQSNDFNLLLDRHVEIRIRIRFRERIILEILTDSHLRCPPRIRQTRVCCLDLACLRRDLSLVVSLKSSSTDTHVTNSTPEYNQQSK